MKKVYSTRNGSIAEIVSKNGEEVILKLADGEEKPISLGTFKRWWKVLEEEVVEETVAIIEEEKAAKPEKKKATPKKADPKPKEVKQENVAEVKEVKPKAPKKDIQYLDIDELTAMVDKVAVLAGTEVFIALRAKGFRSLKVDGKMYAAYTFNKKGLTLWLRSEAIKDITTDYKTINHMFNARIYFNEINAENKKFIEKLLKASIKFQQNKPTKTIKK